MRAGEGNSKQVKTGAPWSDTSAFFAAAHELKAPLSLVRQLSLLLEQDEMTTTERSRVIQQMKLTSERALRLTTDLTKTARLEDALFELEPINPVALCEDIVRDLTPLFVAHGRTIRMARRQKPLLAVANQDLLRRVVTSFSDNALHYASGDGVVELKAQLVGGKVRVGVRDFGPAMPLQLWKKLELQLGAPQAINARPQSSGLGIYIAREFAEAMNGSIGIKRHRDGVSFYVETVASTQLKLL